MTQAEYWATLLPGIIAFFAPAVASFVSREHLPSTVTAAITVATTAAGAFLTELLSSGNYSWSLATLKAFAAYIIAAEARSQFWAGTRADAKLLAFPRKLPASGETSTHFGGIGNNATPDGPSPTE